MHDEEMREKHTLDKPQPLKVLIVVMTGLGILSVLGYCAWLFADRQLTSTSFALSVSIILLSIPSGFIFGILVSPIGSGERSEFSQYAKAATAFASGFVVAKLNETISQIFSPDFALSELGGFRIICFITGFSVAMLLMFGWRRYW